MKLRQNKRIQKIVFALTFLTVFLVSLKLFSDWEHFKAGIVAAVF